jgi:ATP-dependent DNA helicase 2 subunit 2
MTFIPQLPERCCAFCPIRIDIDALFAAKPEPAGTTAVKREETQGGGASPPPASIPKPGRVISNETPLEDFTAQLNADIGDNVAKAVRVWRHCKGRRTADFHPSSFPQMRDLGTVIKENVAASFSSSAFPLALDCLREMRRQAMLVSRKTSLCSVSSMSADTQTPVGGSGPVQRVRRRRRTWSAILLLLN